MPINPNSFFTGIIQPGQVYYSTTQILTDRYVFFEIDLPQEIHGKLLAIFLYFATPGGGRFFHGQSTPIYSRDSYITNRSGAYARPGVYFPERAAFLAGVRFGMHQ